MNNKFYANVQGSVPEAIVACLKKANEIIANDSEVNLIVLYSYTKNNFNTVAQVLGADNVNRMFSQPLRFQEISRPIQCMTERTYNEWQQGANIVICCHMDSKDVQKVDDFHSAKYVLAISWLKDGLSEWAGRWNAECIYGDKMNTESNSYDGLELLRVALKEMDIRMFHYKDFHHPDDENTCKTYIRVIHKYMPEVTSSQIEDLLVTELGWKNGNAIQVGDLHDRLKNGKSFRGGEKTGWLQYFKRWRDNQK